MVVLAHDGGITCNQSHGMVEGLYLAMALCAVQIGHVISLTRDVTSFPVQVRVCLFGVVACRMVGTTPMDSLGPTRRYQCQGRDRVLLSGARIVLGVMEPSVAVIVGPCHAHVLFKPDRHTIVWRPSSTCGLNGCRDELELICRSADRLFLSATGQ